LSDEAFQEGFNFSRTDFIRMRAALMAYADFCLGMADAAEVLSARAFTRPKRAILQREVREWAAPLLSRNHIIGLAAGLSAVEPSVAERIVNHFTIDPDSVNCSGVGDRAPAATRTSSIIRLLLVLRFEAEQFGTVLIGRSGQQPLGLDAGLA